MKGRKEDKEEEKTTNLKFLMHTLANNSKHLFGHF